MQRTKRDRRPTGPSGPAVLALLVGVGVLGVLVPLVAARHSGAFGIPRGDDWSYLQTLFRFAEHGHLDGNRWVSMTLVGQVGLATPVVWVFGRNIGAVQITAALLGLGGLLATYWLGSRIVGRRAAAFLTITIAVGPLWGVLVITFMTDVPAFAASMLALALAVAAVRRAPLSLRLLAASLAAGVFAFSIRQYAIVPVVATVLTASLVARGPEGRAQARGVAALGAVALVACVVIYGLWSQIPNLKTYVPALPDGHSISVTIIKSGGFLRLTGLLLAPVVVLSNPARVLRRAWSASHRATVVSGAGTVCALAALSVRVPGQQFVGNYIDANGALSTDVLLGNRPDLFPAVVYAFLVAVATLSAVVLVLAMIEPAIRFLRRVRSHDLAIASPARFLVGISVVGYAAAYVFAMMTGVSVYDRYALPALPLVAIGFLASVRAAPEVPTVRREADGPGVRRASAATLAILAVVGLAFTVDSAAFDGNRWGAAVAETRAGFARRAINGGFEWVNYYRGSHVPRIVVGAKDGPRAAPTTRTSDFCVSVSVDPKPDGRRVLATRSYGVFTRPDARIMALRNRRCRRR